VSTIAGVTDTDAELVRVAVDGGVATITLDSPANRNALSRKLLRDLHRALDRAEQPDVRAIVLTHVPPAFCAGADLRERSNDTTGDDDTAPAGTTGSPLVVALERLMGAAAPTIAAVKGPVRAGGIGLMAACDLVVVAPSVDFAFTEVRIGVAPAIISVPILRRVPPAMLAAPFLTGERFDAAHAARIGLVSHVSDDVDAQVAALVDGILRGAPGAVAATKRLLHEVPGRPFGEAIREMEALSMRLFRSDEGAEGMRSFLEKRPPRWAPPAH
jgi:enoyl-CoA hydratase/carnithine racemase